MKLDRDIINYLDKSVLCWLATVSKDGQPNVSPKEVFDCFNEETVIIANIASPGSIRNIKENPMVCVSFIDILVQKGYQLKGNAVIITAGEDCFKEMSNCLYKKTQGKFTFSEIIAITPTQSKPIVAPSYMFYPDTKEEDQRNDAIKTYGFNRPK